MIESTAWQVSDEDVQNVLAAHGITVDTDRALEICSTLDHDQIERNTLRFVDIDDQTASSLEDIEQQLMQSGVIPSTHVAQFGMDEEEGLDDDEDIEYDEDEDDEDLDDDDFDDEEDEDEDIEDDEDED